MSPTPSEPSLASWMAEAGQRLDGIAPYVHQAARLSEAAENGYAAVADFIAHAPEDLRRALGALAEFQQPWTGAKMRVCNCRKPGGMCNCKCECHYNADLGTALPCHCMLKACTCWDADQEGWYISRAALSGRPAQ